MKGSACYRSSNNHFLILRLNDIFIFMKKISVPTLFIMLAIPFIVVCGALMSKPRTPVGVPPCYKETVCDKVQILDAAKIKQLEYYHQTLMAQYDIDLRFLTGTITAAETINYYKAAKIGEKSKTKNGALLMIDPQSALLRFHASSGLRDVYDENFVSYLENQQMVPFFKADKVSQGIVVTGEMIVARTTDAFAGKPFVAVDYRDAVTRLLGDQSQPQKNTVATDMQRPAEVVSAYQRMLTMGDTSYDSPVYSKASRAFRMTSSAMPKDLQAEVQFHQNCNIYKEVVLHTGLAAMLYDVTQRQCSPYLLVMENGAWRIDLPSMAKHIRTNPQKEWSMDLTTPFIYADAFLDWTFDKVGVPHPLPPMRWGVLIESDYNAHVTYIKKIYDNTAASKMPIQERDVILKWADLSNPTREDVEKSMQNTPEGQQISVSLWRNGQRFAVDIIAPPPLK